MLLATDFLPAHLFFSQVVIREGVQREFIGFAIHPCSDVEKQVAVAYPITSFCRSRNTVRPPQSPPRIRRGPDFRRSLRYPRKISN